MRKIGANISAPKSACRNQASKLWRKLNVFHSLFFYNTCASCVKLKIINCTPRVYSQCILRSRLRRMRWALTLVRKVYTCLSPYPIHSKDRGRIAGSCRIVECTLPDRSALSDDPMQRREPYVPSRSPSPVSARQAWHRKHPARSTGIRHYCRSTVQLCGRGHHL